MRTRVPGRDAALFICCDTTPEQWVRFLPALTAHRENVTTAIIALYEMSGSGQLVDQGQNVADGIEYASKLRAIGIRTTALIAMSPSGVRAAMYNTTTGEAFIKQLVATASSTGLQGFNLDAEFATDANHTDGTQFVAFLDAMADALHSINCTLSVDVHGDGDKPFDFHVWGPAYKASSVDKVCPCKDLYFFACARFLGRPFMIPLECDSIIVIAPALLTLRYDPYA